MQKISDFAWSLRSKGYSLKRFCELLYQKRGVKCCVSTLETAFATENRNRNQEKIHREAQTLLNEIPINPIVQDNFARMCAERGLTLVSVWKYYNETRPRKYSKGTFQKAMVLPVAAFEFAMREEAEKCLDEMVPPRG